VLAQRRRWVVARGCDLELPADRCAPMLCSVCFR
jgi:hypothetical protein